MSARAVGATLLRQMEQEELIQKCTLEAFCERFASLIESELRSARRDKWDLLAARNATYVVRERLWKNWLERTSREIERKFDERVAAWGDWWVARYGELHAFVLDLLDKIDRKVSETYIQQAQDEASAEDLLFDLRVDLSLNEGLHEEWMRGLGDAAQAAA